MPYPADRTYTKDHEWIRADGDTAEIGITDYAQRQLGDVVHVELPEPGQILATGQTFGTIESVKAVSELFAPMGGEVIAVNTTLTDHPDAINSAPHETWMIRLRLSEPPAGEHLLDSTRYEELTR